MEMLRGLVERGRNAMAMLAAGGVVLIDSTSRVLSMCADLVLVALLVVLLKIQRGSGNSEQ